MNSNFFRTMNPPAYEYRAKAFEKETQTQTENYNLATGNLKTANICYDLGL